MGTVAVDLLPAAADDPLFAGLPDRFLAQATHQQSVLRAPEGATVLARSDHDDCHAFRWGEAAWGVQFHPEFGTVHMRGYVRARAEALARDGFDRSAEHTSELQSLMRLSYAVFCLKKKTNRKQ